jgi:hypothetical protein
MFSACLHKLKINHNRNTEKQGNKKSTQHQRAEYLYAVDSNLSNNPELISCQIRQIFPQCCQQGGYLVVAIGNFRQKLYLTAQL